MDKVKKFLKYIQLKNRDGKQLKVLKLNNMQEECNELYIEEGLTDEVLGMQVEINFMRHEFDIVDPSEVVDDYCQ